MDCRELPHYYCLFHYSEWTHSERTKTRFLCVGARNSPSDALRCNALHRPLHLLLPLRQQLQIAAAAAAAVHCRFLTDDPFPTFLETVYCIDDDDGVPRRLVRLREMDDESSLS